MARLSMKRTPEWYDAYQKRVDGWKAKAAREWNGNIEPVSIAAAPVIAHRAPKAAATPLHPLITLCRSLKIAEPVPEHRFHPGRKWRFDYAWPLYMLAMEVEGGLWTNGRHSRGSGAVADLEKYSEAAILGWRILYCTPEQMHNGIALDRVIRALTDRAAA